MHAFMPTMRKATKQYRIDSNIVDSEGLIRCLLL